MGQQTFLNITLVAGRKMNGGGGGGGGGQKSVYWVL